MLIDLRDSLRASDYHYKFQRDVSALRVVPHAAAPTHRPPPVQELAAPVFLKADKYQLAWRVSAAHQTGIVRCEIHVYIGSYTTPALRYDVSEHPEYAVAFEVRESRTVYFVLRVQTHHPVSVHTLSVHLAREALLGKDPVMFEWDMPSVAAALRQQRKLHARLRSLATLFAWGAVREGLRELRALWARVFPARPVLRHYQNTLLDCRLQSPVLFAASARGITGYLEHAEGDRRAWTLTLGAQRRMEPTALHAQYLIWCFPDREIKIALRRDAPIAQSRVRFTLKGHGDDEVVRDMPWFWLGYNMTLDLPFYNLWCVPVDELEFINWQDVSGVFDAIEEHFSSANLLPTLNDYG